MLAFEREWAAALGESRRTFSLAPLYEVVQGWQGRRVTPGSSTPSSPRATTTARPSTSRSCAEGTGGRTAAVHGPLLRAGREGACPSPSPC
ncbi:DUF6247 family protein [Streptomyces sp. NPDC029080]|uniref:DUF6247 family protein n=1 Tax=Streptomyces sp. NPDC029080 TaxID=3155017 RepID=UPI0033D9CEFD